MKRIIADCPCCNGKLHISALRCPDCGMELKKEYPLSVFDRLEEEQYDFLISFLKNRGNMKVNNVIDVEITHNLLAKKGTNIKNIKKVISHPQALSQCNSYILEKGFEKVESSNTAIAAYELSQSDDDSVAVIASKEVANLYDLEVLQANINESRNNTTRFAVFSKVLNKRKVVNKMGEHFILVFTVLNEAGALAKTLNIIGAHNFNMRTLRSRPMKELLWNYYFFVEADGDINSSDGQDMIRQLKTVCDRLKVVGTYYSQVER